MAEFHCVCAQILFYNHDRILKSSADGYLHNTDVMSAASDALGGCQTSLSTSVSEGVLGFTHPPLGSHHLHERCCFPFRQLTVRAYGTCCNLAKFSLTRNYNLKPFVYFFSVAQFQEIASRIYILYVPLESTLGLETTAHGLIAHVCK